MTNEGQVSSLVNGHLVIWSFVVRRTTFMAPILEARGLIKTYGRRRVVDGVSFYVDPAEIVVLLGPNGAGKTTSFRMTCGMVEPERGQQILLHGELLKHDRILG